MRAKKERKGGGAGAEACRPVEQLTSYTPVTKTGLYHWTFLSDLFGPHRTVCQCPRLQCALTAFLLSVGAEDLLVFSLLYLKLLPIQVGARGCLPLPPPKPIPFVMGRGSVEISSGSYRCTSSELMAIRSIFSVLSF